ncbi:MAG TPA: hypothetical protein VMT89_15645 [Candidatus Acidoferrales bacterium]|nr:hypothetical protein [Candidatus Acidoferrales bacterium]
MRYRISGLLALFIVTPIAAWAGVRALTPAPVLGDAGLIGLGVCLVGTGIAFLRRH